MFIQSIVNQQYISMFFFTFSPQQLVLRCRNLKFQYLHIIANGVLYCLNSTNVVFHFTSIILTYHHRKYVNYVNWHHIRAPGAVAKIV